MPANPNWARWIFASVATVLKEVATDENLASLVEQIEDRSDAFMKANDKVEIRITGPFTQEISKGYHRVWVDANVLISSYSGGATKNANDILLLCGLFHAAMSMPVPVWNYGKEMGDFLNDDPSTQVFIGCLLPRPGISKPIRVGHFGQIDKTDKLRHSSVDVSYEMFLDE